MVHQNLTVVGAALPITLYNDRARKEHTIGVTPALAELLAYADAWARAETRTRDVKRTDDATLTFSSMLAAMAAGNHPLCAWFRRHLALRGSSAPTLTKQRNFSGVRPPTVRLTTSHSFRRALEQAEGLARGRTLDVKHLMAAYPVVTDYHAGEFLRYRIDRRAWCLTLADHLQRSEPPEERAEWRAYAQLAPVVLQPVYRPDVPLGDDLLGMGREIEAFAMLIAASDTLMPLSIGVFGGWGSGKSYFMCRVEERVDALAASRGPGGRFLERIAQVRFNAWHYSEGDVVASLVDQIFRNLRFGPAESGAKLAEKRAEVLAQLTAADQEWRELRAQAEEAEADEARLRNAWREANKEHAENARRINDELLAGQAAVVKAEEGVAELLEAQASEIVKARQGATLGVAADIFVETIRDDPELAQLGDAAKRAADEAEWLGANGRTVAWGILLVVLTAAAARTVEWLGDQPVLATIGTLMAAAAPFAARALTVLRDLAKKGAAFREAIHEKSEQAIKRLKAAGEDALRTEEAALEAVRARVESLRAELTKLASVARQAEQALVEAEQRRTAMEEQLEQSATAVASARRRLDSVTLGSLLGETIAEAAGTDVFRKRLGTLAHARSYFQRLSETMDRARAEHAEGRGEPPVLERVVLYIDDLDRCPEEKVREVLQAVHLLLAFDLFACVVAVDPRWVIQCLAGSPGVVNPQRLGDALRDADLEVLGGLTTPSDYLEKIFQIPLWLRPVPSDRRAAVAAAMFAADPATSARREEVAASQGESEDHWPRREAGEATVSRQRGDRAAEPEKFQSRQQVGIDPSELRFLEARIAPLLDGNARALKRFVNTYHLVKSALSDTEFDFFVGRGNVGPEPTAWAPYRICMAQLALLATQRRRARLLAKLVEEALADGGPSTLGNWLDRLRAGPTEGQDIGAHLSQVLLADEPALTDMPFDRFALWFERTRRYSFYL